MRIENRVEQPVKKAPSVQIGPTRWLAMSLVVALATGPSIAQEAGTEVALDQGFIETLDVSVVNVEVYVTDKSGQRILGLEKDDFVLEVDRKPVAITNFYAVDEPPPEVGAAAAARIARRVNPTELPIIPAEQRLHLVLFVDNFNLHPHTRNRTFRAVRSFLRTLLSPGDQVMLVTYDRSLHVRHPFTSDPELVASVLYEIEEMSGFRVQQDSDRRELLQNIYDAENIYDIQGQAVSHVEQLFTEQRFTLDALTSFVRDLAGLPGRKAVLHISDGLTLRAGEDIFHALNDKFDRNHLIMDSLRYDLTKEFQQLTNLANANRVTFYTVDAAGLRTYASMDVRSRNPGGGTRVDQIHINNMHSSLSFLARETGGLVILNTNNALPKLQQVAEDFRSYYSLGFSPASAGRYHSIKVRLKNRQKGVDIRVRDGYRDKPAGTKMSEGTMAALHFGYQANSFDAEIRIGESETREDGRFFVPIFIRIPIHRVSFLPNEAVYRGRVRLFISAKDQEGGVAPVSDVLVPIDIPADEFESAQKELYQYEIKLLMRGGRQVIAVGIRDEIGAVSGFVSRGVNIGARSAARE